MSDDWAAAFAATFSTGATPIEQQVYATVLGDEHPSELDTYSCLTRSELTRLTTWLAGIDPEVVVDVGCGRAGPGVWVATRTGARLVGLDVTEAPFGAAAARADQAGVKASLRLGSFAATGLSDGAVDAVLSVDALQFAASTAEALAEVTRILRPGGRLALTMAESVDDLDTAITEPPALASVARSAGLDVATCDTPPDWPRTARRIADAMLAASRAIAAETGAAPDDVRDALERLASHRRQERRVLLLAARPD